VNVIRPVFADGSDLVATATVAHLGRKLAIASTEIVGADGKTVALATGTTSLGEAAELRAAEATGVLSFESA
jgi:uncharacterized protein (TIGR00369 family)